MNYNKEKNLISKKEKKSITLNIFIIFSLIILLTFGIISSFFIFDFLKLTPIFILGATALYIFSLNLIFHLYLILSNKSIIKFKNKLFKLKIEKNNISNNIFK